MLPSGVPVLGRALRGAFLGGGGFTRLLTTPPVSSGGVGRCGAPGFLALAAVALERGVAVVVAGGVRQWAHGGGGAIHFLIPERR